MMNFVRLSTTAMGKLITFLVWGGVDPTQNGHILFPLPYIFVYFFR